MEDEKNLAELCKEISQKIVTSIYLNEIICDIVDGEKKTDLLLTQQQELLSFALKANEECRRKIYIED